MSNSAGSKHGVCRRSIRRYDRSAFSRGVTPLDCYLKRQASQDARRNVAVPFVLVAPSKRIAGYYTLSIKILRLPRYPELPATLVGRLAVDSAYRGRRVGEFLLLDAMKRAWVGSLQVASLGVIVDAKDKPARQFYLRYEFLPLLENGQRLFLPMQTITKLLAGAERFGKSGTP